ncbi:MAG: SLC13 family permease [Gammaproteobacteria bacterium]
MSTLQIYLSLGIFAAVIVAIALDLIDMAVAALLGVCALIASGVLGGQDAAPILDIAGGPLALLFGGMVVARTLATTGIFERIGSSLLRATGGSGKRFLLLLIALVAPVCALLPNATAVVLLAPIIIRLAVALKVDIVAPMILTAIVSNSAGLLTLVGDPATFLVGSSIGMSFGQYLHTVSLGGLLSVLVLIPMLPVLFRDVWRVQTPLPPVEPPKPIERPWFAVLGLGTLAAMVVLFLGGESLPKPIGPPAAAIVGAALALLAVYAAKIEPVEAVLRDIDWKTLVFLTAIFCLVQGVSKTGLLQSLSLSLNASFGNHLIAVALVLLAGIGVLSGLLANTPVVAASLVMVKGYLVAAEAVPELGMAPGFADWPAATVPVFVAMMFGGTLGGNGTLIGASANVVAAGICASQGRRVTFAGFLRYGLPVAAAQIVVSAIYVLILFQFRQ